MMTMGGPTQRGFKVYLLYLAIKRHFTTKTYDYHKYRGKVNASFSAYEVRPDLWVFEKLARKYNDGDIQKYLMSNLFMNPNLYSKDLLSKESERNYNEWCKRVESMSYRFDEDLTKLCRHAATNLMTLEGLLDCSSPSSVPLITQWTMNGTISPETYIILDRILGFANRHRGVIISPNWIQWDMRMTKYAGFLFLSDEQMKSYKSTARQIVQDHFQNRQ